MLVWMLVDVVLRIIMVLTIHTESSVFDPYTRASFVTPQGARDCIGTLYLKFPDIGGPKSYN